MTVEQLLEELQHLVDTGYGDTQVRVATQPAWPLAFEVSGVGLLGNADAAEETDDPDPEPDPDDAVAWLVAGDHPSGASPYAPSILFRMGFV